MRIKDFDFPLPDSLIAERPAEKRDLARLLVLHTRRDGDGGAAPLAIEHKRFCDIADYLHAGDMLLLNNTKVMPVRLIGRKKTGGRLEILLVKKISGNTYEVLCRERFRGRLRISDRLQAEVTDGRTAELLCDGDPDEVLREEGLMPLPPYIKRLPDAMDKERYQTVYARAEGSIAAPTAGLHFTEALLRAIEEKGVLVRCLTLHVGVGTFRPVRAERLEDHAMLPERFEIDRGLMDEIAALRGRLFAVGTTTTRALEGYLSGKCDLRERQNGSVTGSTDIFICPGYEFRAVKGLITNFHLPGSTPLMLAAAFAGRRRLLGAYDAAIMEGYRFFSYGDAMLIL